MTTARTTDWPELLHLGGRRSELALVLWMAGCARLDAGAFTDAAAIFEGLDRIDPDAATGQTGIAEVARAAGRFGEAKRHALQAAERRGADRDAIAYALLLAGQADIGRRRYQDAQQTLRRALPLARGPFAEMVRRQLEALDQTVQALRRGDDAEG